MHLTICMFFISQALGMHGVRLTLPSQSDVTTIQTQETHHVCICRTTQESVGRLATRCAPILQVPALAASEHHCTRPLHDTFCLRMVWSDSKGKPQHEDANCLRTTKQPAKLKNDSNQFTLCFSLGSKHEFSKGRFLQKHKTSA